MVFFRFVPNGVWVLLAFLIGVLYGTTFQKFCKPLQGGPVFSCPQLQTEYSKAACTTEKKISDAFLHTKATKEIHCYGWMYSEVLAPYVGKSNMRMMEIGLDQGGSLKLWRDIFPEAEIHGLESGTKHGIERAKEQAAEALKDGVVVHVGSQDDPDFLQEISAQVEGGFDIIIDDGGHSAKNQIASLQHLWRTIKPGGVYIIEDLETQYYISGSKSGYGCYGQDCGGGYVGKKGTTIAVLKQFIDVLNRDFHDGPNNFNINQQNGHGTYSVVEGDQNVASLQCFRNMCALRKLQGSEFVSESGCKTS